MKTAEDEFERRWINFMEWYKCDSNMHPTPESIAKTFFMQGRKAGLKEAAGINKITIKKTDTRLQWEAATAGTPPLK